MMDKTISLAIAPPIFLGPDQMFDKMERVVLNPEGLFNMPLFDGEQKKDNPIEQSPIGLFVPSFYDFLSLCLNHLPYLAPPYLIIMPSRFPLTEGISRLGLLPFQQSLLSPLLYEATQPKQQKILWQSVIASLTLRSLTALDLEPIDNKKHKNKLSHWQNNAISQLTPLVDKNYHPLPWHRWSYLDHVIALHRLIAGAMVMLYREQNSPPNKIDKTSEKISRPALWWWHNKKIHYHLFALLGQAKNPPVLPFLTLLNLSAVSQWLVNSGYLLSAKKKPSDGDAISSAEQKTISDIIHHWRSELYQVCQRRSYDDHRDMYPMYLEALEKIDKQLRHCQLTLKRPNLNNNPCNIIGKNFAITLGEKNLPKKTKRGVEPSLHWRGQKPIIWQRNEGRKFINQTLNLDLAMSFNIAVKKKPFFLSGAWFMADPQKNKLQNKLQHDSQQPIYHYIGNQLHLRRRPPWQPTAFGQLLRHISYRRKGANLMIEWRQQKTMAEVGDIVTLQKKFHDKKNIITIERKFFVPLKSLDKNLIYQCEEKIIAPAGLDFFILLPLDPNVKAFGKSGSHIDELQQHWHRGLLSHRRQKNLASDLIGDSLIPEDNPEENLRKKMASLQEIFLESADKQGGRFIASGATLSLTKAMTMTAMGPTPCQAIMLYGQTAPMTTTITYGFAIS